MAIDLYVLFPYKNSLNEVTEFEAALNPAIKSNIQILNHVSPGAFECRIEDTNDHNTLEAIIKVLGNHEYIKILIDVF